MAQLTIADDETRVQYTVGSSASTGPFAIPFEFFANSDIKVIITNTTTLVDTVLAQHPSGFTITATAADDGFLKDGSLSLAVAVSNSLVTVYADYTLTKTSNFPLSGAFDIASLNTQFSRVFAALKQQSKTLSRNIAFSRSDSTTSFTIPASRADKILSFDSSSNLEATVSKAQIVDAQTHAIAAAASETAALLSENAAAASATAATTNGAAQVTLAQDQVTLATAQANAATTNGAAQVTLATTQANNAANSATAAANSAASVDIASQAEAEAGTSTKLMSALRTKQAVDSYGLLAANNLSDVTAATARTNLGLGTAATQASTAFQAADADTAKTDVVQTFTVSQRGSVTTDADLSFDLGTTNNFSCTPTGTGTLTFTNITAGQSGNILLINSGGHSISLHANTKGDSKLASTISTAGTYWLSYFCGDNTNVQVVTSPVFA